MAFNIFNTMIKRIKQWQSVFYLFSFYLYVLPIHAVLPTPPPDDLPSGTNDFIDVVTNLAYKSLRPTCIIVGVLLAVGSAYGIFHAYSVARDKQDLGHFFKHGGVSVFVAVLGIAMLYYGYQMMPSS